ncbi:MAG: hypothetical protein DCC58_14335 [Chloroflexi bacterium]|nr:MAG: hypothetical protein DCC58_14335 [Chloroflexota bacterium]
MLDNEVGHTTQAGRHSETQPPLGKSNSDYDDEFDEEDVPTVVLYVIAGLLILSFSLYLIVGGGHSHFH